MPLRAITGPRSSAIFRTACGVFPGGVNSPVRAWKRLGGKPPVLVRGRGADVYDADGNRWLDCVLSWGPLILGHAEPAVVKAVQAAAARGLGFGAPTPYENRLAELIRDGLPSMERLRLVSSGTEACMSALRLARAATGRELVIKFDGCYHGHADHLLVAAGSGCATLNTPDSTGVPADFAAKTLSVPFNDALAVERLFRKHRGRIAAVIVEPVAGNMGLVLPRAGFLERLRELCTAGGALLVFDEVMTGFRVAWGGWQRVCGVTPDLTTLGKVVGGGLPAAAYGGRRDVMEHLAPLGGCYQAGTLSGNPVAVAAGTATLEGIRKRRGFYEVHGAHLATALDGVRKQAQRHGVAVQLAQAGLMWGYVLGDQPVHDMDDVAASDLDAWKRFTEGMLRERVYLAPSPFEAAFWSSAHGASGARRLAAAAGRAFAAMR